MSQAATIDALANRIRPHYSRFLGPLGDRILLTGHSHQAWPDVAREGHMAAWDDAARLIDGKWGRVFDELIPELQAHIARRLGSSRPGDLALAPNTHELVYRLASCFPLDSTVLTTGSEFHSMRRQLTRLGEAGTRLVRVEVEQPGASFPSRFIAAAERERPTWAALSWVFFNDARVVEGLPEILAALARLEIPVLVDAYHAFNLLELDTDSFAGDVFVTGGGYKYAECGEGVCFMLIPREAERYRPLSTGWFSDFHGLEESAASARVRYGRGGARFFGATFDPTPVYRALAVFRFMDAEGLTPRVLEAQSKAQTELIFELHAQHGLDACLPIRTPRASRGGFVSMESPEARAIARRLFERGVHADARGDLLRLGPAPYLRSSEIARAMEILASLTK